MQETDRAYVAGLFDGDGSVFMREVYDKNLERTNVVVEVAFTMQSQETLEWLVRLFGGKVTGPHANYRGYTWKIAHGKRVIPFLETIQPYCITKRTQVDFVLYVWREFFGDMRGGGKPMHPFMLAMRHVCCQILQQENKRDSMYFHGKGDEFREHLSSLLEDMATLSRALEVLGSKEGATTSQVSTNNNPDHEPPPPTH